MSSEAEDQKKISDNNNTLATLPKYLSGLINIIIEQEKITSLETIHVNEISTEGGNYLGDLYEINISGQTEHGDKALNLFLKKALATENTKSKPISDFYLIESFVYSDLLVMFDEIQDKANIPENERFKAAKSFTQINAEIIVLENLVKKGFKTLYRMDVVPLIFAELSIQKLAKYHALSFALEKYNPEYFLKCKQMKYPIEIDDEFVKFLDNLSDTITDHLSPQTQEKVKNFVKKIPEILKRCFFGPSTVSTLCHGDYRANNILVKEKDGVPTEVIPVDYQIVHYKCPVNDLLYFLYSGTDREFREKYMEHLKDLYHETFGNFLLHFKIDVDTVFPRKEFDNIIDNRMEYALALALMLIPFLFSNENETPELTSGSLADITFKLDDRFKDRLQGNIEEFTELGYL